jgi:hypothetical protein
MLILSSGHRGQAPGGCSWGRHEGSDAHDSVYRRRCKVSRSETFEFSGEPLVDPDPSRRGSGAALAPNGHHPHLTHDYSTHHPAIAFQIAASGGPLAQPWRGVWQSYESFGRKLRKFLDASHPQCFCGVAKLRKLRKLARGASVLPPSSLPARFFWGHRTAPRRISYKGVGSSLALPCGGDLSSRSRNGPQGAAFPMKWRPP